VEFQVIVGIGNEPINNFLVDTGAESTFVSASLALQAGLVKSLSDSRGYAGLDCPVGISHYRVASWGLSVNASSGHFAQFELAPQIVFSSILSPGVMGLLGAGTLLRYSPVVIDYRDGDLLLGTLNRK
jgi:hypothetical protein